MINKIVPFLALLICLALTIPALDCSVEQSGNVEQAVGSANLKLNLEKAPRLNEPVKLSCIRQTKGLIPPGQLKKISDNNTNNAIISDNLSENNFIPPGLEKPKREKIIMEFERVDLKTYSRIKVPAQEVLVGSNLNWEADITGEPLDFSATIKFPFEGNWGVYAQSTLDPMDKASIFLNIAEDSSSFGWPPDYRPHTSPGPYSPTQYLPITVELDIPKPPRLNEPVQLTWSLNSIRDVDGVIGKVDFWHLEGTTGAKVPVEDMLIEGDLTWTGSLKKDSPLYFSATVTFPLEGDWEIRAHGDSFAEQQPINSSYPLFLHIDKDKSRWGWTESHEIKHGGPPPPVVPVPQMR